MGGGGGGGKLCEFEPWSCHSALYYATQITHSTETEAVSDFTLYLGGDAIKMTFYTRQYPHSDFTQRERGTHKHTAPKHTRTHTHIGGDHSIR